jgi:hypothetical protein
MSIKTEFVTFVVKAGMEAEAEAWMNLLIRRQQECIETLDPEHMHYECIFRSFRNGRLCLSWFSVQGSAGRDVRDLPQEINKLHLEFWDKCIDTTVAPEKFEHLVSFVPPTVAAAISQREVSLRSAES